MRPQHVAVLLGLAAASGPRAAAAEATLDLVFVQDHALWRRPFDPGGEPTKLVDLGPNAEVNRLVAAAGGSALVAETAHTTAWLDLADSSATWVYLPCAGAAILSADGGTLGCPARGGGLARFHLRDEWSSELLDGGALAGFADPAGTRAVVLADDGLRVVGSEVTVTGLHPDGAALVAPDGSRATAVFGQDSSRVLESFGLVKDAARRKLLDDAEPIAWSGDSRWILVQQGEGACAVRAVGGEYKCWDGFTGLALSYDASRILLAKPSADGATELFAAVLAGAHATAPRSLGGARGPVVLVPGR